MRRITGIGAALIALAAASVVAAVVVPFAIADRIWAVVAQRAGVTTGARITADGPVRLKLFPAPRLLVSGVEIANAAEESLVHIDRARLELAWSDLLLGLADAKRLQLRHARFLTLPPHPPVDIDIERNGPTATIVASFEGGSVRGAVEAGATGLDLRMLVVALGGYTARGSGQLTLGGDPRLVLTLDRIEDGIALLGQGAAAMALADDGLLIERLRFQGAKGAEASFFGLAVPDHGALRLEGGLEGSVPTPGGAAEITARLAATLGRENGRLDLNDIDLRSAGSRLSGSLRAELSAEPSVTADLRLDALDLGGAKMLPPGLLAPLAIAPRLELRARIGRVTWPGALAEGVILDIVRTGPQVTMRELAARNIGGAPFHAQARLVLGLPDPTLTFDSLVFRYATLSGAGHGSIDVSGPVPRIRLDAALNGPLALDAIVPPLPPLPPEPMTRRAAAATTPRPPPAATGWSRERLFFPSIPPIEADFRLTIPRLSWRGFGLDEAELDGRVGDAVVSVDRLAGRLYGGRFELNGRAALMEGIPAFSGSATVAGSDLKAVLRDYAGITAIAGSLDGSAQLAASGSSPAELMAGLKGIVQIRGHNGTIEGFNLPGVSDGLKRLQRPTGLAEVFRLGLGGGRTPFSALEGAFRIERGVARTDNLRLLARAAEVRMAGQVNLAAWTLDVTNQFRLTEHPDLPPFMLKLSGLMDAPRRVFDIQELQAQLVRRGREPARQGR